MSKQQSVHAETGLDEGRSANKLSAIKKNIMKIIPFSILVWIRSWKYRRRLHSFFKYDASLLERYSSIVYMGDNQRKLQALVTLAYHNIEKGLSLRNPRPLFGRPAIEKLLLRLERYVANFGWDEVSSVAFNVLTEYHEYNVGLGKDDPELKEGLGVLQAIGLNDTIKNQGGGTKTLTKQEIHKYSRIDLSDFFKYRSSIRNYAEGEVDRLDIVKAVKMAQKTPSVCNRQSGRVIAVDEPTSVRELLDLQGGARGFSEQVPCLLIITSELSRFQSTGERFQCWIDGGLFAMTLVYALHSLGYGTCCLNWSKDPSVDKKFYEKFPQYRGERVIMFLAVGHIPDELTVPQSCSPPLESILRWENQPAEGDYEPSECNCADPIVKPTECQEQE